MIIEKVGVIGDVHAEDKILENIINFLDKMDFDVILCTGDIVDGQGDVNKCVKLLQKANVVTVSGNHDRWIIRSEMRDLNYATDLFTLSSDVYDFVLYLPKIFEMETPSGLLLLCHGIGENDMAQLNPYDEGYAIEANDDLQNLLNEHKYKFVIGGHTHKKMVRKFNDMFFINAGTLKQEKDPCFLTIDFIEEHLQFYQIDLEEKIYKGDSHILT